MSEEEIARLKKAHLERLDKACVIAVQSGMIVDGTGAEPVRRGVILIEGDRIIEVGSPEEVHVPSDAKVIDLRDMVVLPGIVNPHFHVDTRNGEGALVTRTVDSMNKLHTELRTGVTTVRCLGDFDYLSIYLREAIDHEQCPGPRVLSAGYAIKSAHGHGYMGKVFVGEDEIRRAIRDNMSPKGMDRRGADCTKIFINGGTSDPWSSLTDSYLSRSEIKTAIDETHAVGRKIAAHATGGIGTTAFIELGGDSVEHGSACTHEQADLMVEKGTYLDGTIYYYFPPKVRADIAASPRLFRKWLSSRNNFKNVFEYALESGVRYTVASDGASAIMLWEIEILVRVFGVSPLDAIKAGTMSSADCCGILNEVGTLESGKYADIIAVKNNPLEDIKALMNISYLMKAGRQYNWASGKFEDPGGPWN